VHAMISPYSCFPGQTTAVSATIEPDPQGTNEAVRLIVPTGVDGQRKRARAAPSDRSPSRWQRGRSPLSTGCPGPFHAQPPVQPDLRRRPPQPFPCHVGLWERLDAGAPRRDIVPNLTNLSVRLASPVLD